MSDSDAAIMEEDDRKPAAVGDTIDLLRDESDDDNDNNNNIKSNSKKPTKTSPPKTNKKTAPRKNKPKKKSAAEAAARPLQAGLVLKEDVEECVQETAKLQLNDQDENNNNNNKNDVDNDENKLKNKPNSNWTVANYLKYQQQRNRDGHPMELFHDEYFECVPASIEGTSRQSKVEKCRCSPAAPVVLAYITKGKNKGRPYHTCGKMKSTNPKCQYFRWAFKAQQMQWHRFGFHTGHVLVRNAGFSANDLLQGSVGDCWFLSALAVIAEREDLIARIFGNSFELNDMGILGVNLFMEGTWRKIVIDNFLPCIIQKDGEAELGAALKASMGIDSNDNTNATANAFQGRGHTLTGSSSSDDTNDRNEGKTDVINRNESSKYNPHAMSDKNASILAATESFLRDQNEKPVNPYAKKKPSITASALMETAKTTTSLPHHKLDSSQKLDRMIMTEDLAYSKTRKSQLWVQMLEKAYAKSHGSYQSISGGHIAEAFLDLTGSPTEVFNLHNDHGFDPRAFWYKLLSYRRQRLPMGCGTSSSAQGIIGMHAYSIIDVVEVKNVSVNFFREKLSDRTLGNVSGFTSFDGTVRLLKIRNPHGKGEWKGEFSDDSSIWKELAESSFGGIADLDRSMRDDGTFFIDYDSFLQAFSNVDVVLAFKESCARSFQCNFPEKKSNHRVARAFEVSLLDPQPGIPTRDTVEIYCMGIQKTRRGASHGRSDRKVSYKLSDFGIMIGHSTYQQNGDDDSDGEALFESVEGTMFGFKRNEHYRLILNRKKLRRLIVMPVSFGHPAATDKNCSFAVRFVADSPVFIRELSTVPRIDRVLERFCFPSQPNFRTKQGQKKIIIEDDEGIRLYGEPLYRIFQIDYLANRGGVVFVYLCVNQKLIELKGIQDFSLDLGIEARCRGMMCRTETGFLQHETFAKGKKFEAAWRKFQKNFYEEATTRLLMVLVQSGQDSEMGGIICEVHPASKTIGEKAVGEKVQATISSLGTLSSGNSNNVAGFDKLGIFFGSHSTQSKDAHAAMFGRISSVPFKAGTSMSLDVFDLDLERALALSRGDIEMKEALDLTQHQAGFLSPNHVVAQSKDKGLQLALARSKGDTLNTSGSARAPEAIDADTYGDDLNEAIKRSLGETTTASRKKQEPEVIDLYHAEIVDQKPCPKRQKVADPVIEIIDDSDDEEDELKVRQEPPVNETTATGTDGRADERVTATDGGAEEAVEASVVDKRRLAALAAEKRFQSRE